MDNILATFNRIALQDENSFAKALANYMFREIIEDAHAKYNISQEDMKAMCKSAVNRASVLTEHIEMNDFWKGFRAYYSYDTLKWDAPEGNEIDRIKKFLEEAESEMTETRNKDKDTGK